MEQDFRRFSIAKTERWKIVGQTFIYRAYNVDRYRLLWNIGCNYTAQMFTRYVMRGVE